MKPSARVERGVARRQARSAAAQTSAGRSSPQFRYWDSALWNSRSSPCRIASW